MGSTLVNPPPAALGVAMGTYEWAANCAVLYGRLDPSGQGWGQLLGDGGTIAAIARKSLRWRQALPVGFLAAHSPAIVPPATQMLQELMSPAGVLGKYQKGPVQGQFNLCQKL